MRPGRAAEAAGFRLETHAEIASTNDRALAAARCGDAGDLWIVAGAQTGGRGRQGRVWRSYPGNLYASLLLVSPCAPARAPQLGFVAAVALIEALRRLAPEADAFRLKWPNDLLARGAKAAGLLLEGSQAGDRFACAIGFGVNCAAHPEDLHYPATDLSAELGRPIRREALFSSLSDAMAESLALWAGGANFSEIRRLWLRAAARLGETVSVDRGGTRVSGRFETIDVDGRLVLLTQDGRLTLEAGDVLAPADKGAQAPEASPYG